MQTYPQGAQFMVDKIENKTDGCFNGPETKTASMFSHEGRSILPTARERRRELPVKCGMFQPMTPYAAESFMLQLRKKRDRLQNMQLMPFDTNPLTQNRAFCVNRQEAPYKTR